MKVNRLKFLELCKYLSSGIASREIIEQSSCIAFQGNEAYTFNDEISVHAVVPFTTPDATVVPAKELIRLLEKLKPEEVDITFDKGRMGISTGKTEAFINTQKTINLPLDELVKEKEKQKWVDYSPLFLSAIEESCCCTTTDTIRPSMFCVHITDKYMEATTGNQMIRTEFVTGLKEEQDILVPSSAAKELKKLPRVPGKLSVTNSWLHLKLEEPAICVSCRLFISDYPPLDRVMEENKKDPISLKIPESIIDSLGNMMALQEEEFSTERVRISFERQLITLYKETIKGSIQEKNRIKYEGEPFTIIVHPVLFQNLLTMNNEIAIGKRSIGIAVKGDGFLKTSVVVRYKEEKNEKNEK